MTAAADVFDEPAFHAAQRARLCDGALRLPLAPPFADALVAQLQRYCPGHLSLPMGPEAVADCFASVPAERTDRLLRAVHKACQACPAMDEAATHWATELTVYAALRCLDLAYWAGLRNWQGAGKHASARVHTVPTSSSLIAAIGAAGLQGLAIRLSQLGGLDGVIDLSDAHLHTNVEETLLIRMYELLMPATDDRTRNPYAPLDGDEVGKLRIHFDKYRLDDEFAGLYLRLPRLDQEGFDAVARGLASVLNTHVIRGAADHSEDLVRVDMFTVSSLKATVDEIFQELSAYQRPMPALATSPARADAPSSAPGSAAPVFNSAPQPGFRWDLFVSHASEDKHLFVEALVKGLKAVGRTVWYDSSEMTGGGSLVRNIDEGLRGSRFCVVVASPNYFAKAWARGELDAMLNHDLSHGGARVLPVVLDMKDEDIAHHSPLLANRVVVARAADGMANVIVSLLKAINTAA